MQSSIFCNSLAPFPSSHSSFFPFIIEIESCFSEQEIRSPSHSTGQSNREMTGATGSGYLQPLFIYLCSDVIWCQCWRRAEKQYSFFLMALPSTDNVPLLFPFSWISQAAACARNAKCCFVLTSTRLHLPQGATSAARTCQGTEVGVFRRRGSPQNKCFRDAARLPAYFSRVTFKRNNSRANMPKTFAPFEVFAKSPVLICREQSKSN